MSTSTRLFTHALRYAASLFLLPFLAVDSASAGVILTDCAGDFTLGHCVLDESTGLEWLQPTLSQGMTYYEVKAEFGGGGAFEGFRHANEMEWDAFRTLTEIGGVSYDPHLTPPTETSLYNCAGSVCDGGYSLVAFEGPHFDFSLENPNPGQYGPLFSIDIDIFFAFYGEEPLFSVYRFLDERDAVGATFGHALVRESTAVPLPEPNPWQFTLSILASGFFIAGLTTRNRSALAARDPGSPSRRGSVN